MHRTRKAYRRMSRIGALWVSILLILSLWPIAALATGDPQLTANLDHITIVEGPDMDLGVMTFVIEAEAGYKLPEKEDVTILADGQPVTNFAYNPIGGASPLKKCAVLLPTVLNSAAITASAIEFSHDATLSSLQYQYPNAGQAFDVPDFSPTTYEYDVALPSFVAPNAWVWVDAEKSAGNLAHFSGADYDEGGVRLTNGAATCTYTVTAEDGTTTQDYTIHFTTADPVPGSLDAVYLNGVTGSDRNDGATAATAVKTFAKAQSLLAVDGVLSITNTVTVSDNQTWNLSGWGAARIVRDAGFHKALVKVQAGGKLVLSNLTLDGGGTMAGGQPGGILGSQMVVVASGGQLDLADGACVTGHTATPDLPYESPYYYAAIVSQGAVRLQQGSSVTQCFNDGADGGAAGIDNVGGTLLLAGGTVSGCHNPYGVGGVYTSGDTQMTAGAIQDNAGLQGAGVFVQSGSFSLSNGAIARNIQTSQNATDYGQGGGGLYVQEGTVTITGGSISQNTATSFGGGILVDAGSVVLSGGSVQGNTALQGGGLFLYNADGSLSLGGTATLQGNAACQGGGLYVYEGTVTLQEGASLSDNRAQTKGNVPGTGGGVMMFGGLLAQTGGSISGNAADSMGGGLFLQYGVVDLSGGTITGNTAGASGGGLHLYGSASNIAARVSGDVRITGNARADGAADNVFLREGRAMQVSGPLTGEIGLTTLAQPTLQNGVQAATGGTAYVLQEADVACLVSDVQGLHLVLRQGTAYAELLPYEIAIAPTDHGDVTASAQTATVGEEVTLTLTPAQGYELASLSVVQPDGTEVPVTDNKFTMPESAVTVTAAFRALPGDLTIQPLPQPGAPQAKLPQSQAELEAAVLSDADRAALEAGQDVAITLQVKPTFPSSQEVAQMQAALDGHTVGLYLDISLFKRIGDGQPQAITRTGQPIRIVLDIPEELRAEGRTFSILRMHEGRLTVLPDLDDNPNTLTLETDRFSTYALAYTQAGQPAATPSPTLAPTATATPSSTPSARTGDAKWPLGWLLLAALAAGGLLLLGWRRETAKR